MYDCHLDEMRDPLESYKNLGEFFTRHLKEGVRPMGDGMVSPVDGRVLIFGEVKDYQVEQIKGTTVHRNPLIGDGHSRALQVSLMSSSPFLAIPPSTTRSKRRI